MLNRKVWVCKLGMLAIIGAVQLASQSVALAESLSNAPMIFDVRRSLPLEAGEQVYHDFYINAGPEVGFRKGQYMTVVRSLPVHDPVQNKQQATLNVTVARLQVIQSERNLTVARLYNELGGHERPTLEFEAVMIGDRIDVATLTMNAPGKKVDKAPKAETKRESAMIVEAATATAVNTSAPAAQPKLEEAPAKPVPPRESAPAAPAPAPSIPSVSAPEAPLPVVAEPVPAEETSPAEVPAAKPALAEFTIVAAPSAAVAAQPESNVFQWVSERKAPGLAELVAEVESSDSLSAPSEENASPSESEPDMVREIARGSTDL